MQKPLLVIDDGIGGVHEPRALDEVWTVLDQIAERMTDHAEAWVAPQQQAVFGGMRRMRKLFFFVFYPVLWLIIRLARRDRDRAIARPRRRG